MIADGDIVLCDFGGTMDGYCSDITRMFHVGEPPAEVRDAYAVLVEAQEAGVRAATVGTPCDDVDAAARRVIADAGFGEYFVHRVGHGIGTEAHEDPYMVAGNASPLEAGHAFSVEPGIYFPGRFGMRLEDIVVATDAGPRRLERRAARPRDRRLIGPREARRRDVPAAVGDRRAAVLLGHDAPARGEPRLRLAAPQRVRRDGDRRGRAVRDAATSRPRAASRSARRSACVRRAPRSRSRCRCVRRRAGVRGREELRADRRARVAAMVGRRRRRRCRRERRRRSSRPRSI